ncbi:MAG TPA: transposase [Flavobacteriales bacterium]|nr:transposase [Flavobacteriales bacterium]
MEHLTSSYLSRAELWLFITMLAYFLMNGAQLFETFVLVPKWSAAPPDSFVFFRAPHGIDLKTFWIIAHSLHEITFVLALVFCWKLDIRNALLVLFVLHVAVRVWTLMYFAPNVIDFQGIANGAPSIGDLLSRTTLWRNLNYVRVGLFVAVSAGLVPLYLNVLRLVAR